MPDSIIKTIEIAAPVEKVWDALIDHEKFGIWFRVALDQPFAVGQASTGHMTYPGYEDYRWEARVVAIEPMTRFAYEWPATGGDKALMESGVAVPEWTGGVSAGAGGKRHAADGHGKRVRQGAGTPAEQRHAG